MLPFIIEKGDLPFKNLDYILFPGIRKAVEEKADTIRAIAIKGTETKEFTLTLGDLTDRERQIILDGCLINFNRQK
jgi:aconitate hydratase